MQVTDRKLALCSAALTDSFGARACTRLFRKEMPEVSFVGPPSDTVVTARGAATSRGGDRADWSWSGYSDSTAPHSRQSTSAKEANDLLRVVDFQCKKKLSRH